MPIYSVFLLCPLNFSYYYFLISIFIAWNFHAVHLIIFTPTSLRFTPISPQFSVLFWQLQSLFSIYLRVWGSFLGLRSIFKELRLWTKLILSRRYLSTDLTFSVRGGTMNPSLSHTGKLTALILCRQPQLLRVYKPNSLLTSRRHCCGPVLHSLWVSQYFWPSFIMVPEPWGWVWYGHFTCVQVFHSHLLFSEFWPVVTFVVNHSPLDKLTSLMRHESCATRQVERCKLHWQFDTMFINKIPAVSSPLVPTTSPTISWKLDLEYRHVFLSVE